MESLKELYRIGPGPSSSHSLGVRNGCIYYRDRYPYYDKYVVELYGSLALTGKGHMSDKVIYEYFGEDKVEVYFCKEMLEQPNTMKLYTKENGQLTNEMTIYSIGGGAIEVKGEPSLVDENVYPQKDLHEIIEFCNEKGFDLAQYVYHYEPGIKLYLNEVYQQILQVVSCGLQESGYLPGPLHLEKVAHKIYAQAKTIEDQEVRNKLLLSSYAYSAMEQSSSGKIVVTAPTLGASGVMAALVYYYHDRGVSDDKIIDALAAGGVIGNVVKTNATISGARGGCQAEIGTACAMGAAFASYLEGLSLHQIEYAAEVAMEHHLGLTCDPVGGYVQIPCIERNGVAVLRAVDAMNYAKYIGSFKENKVSFDMIVEVMNHTGNQIPMELKETSLGGLALELKPDETNTEI